MKPNAPSGSKPASKPGQKPSLKIHRPTAELVISALQQTFEEGYYADKVLERLFKNNKQVGSRDRKFIAESTYDIVRWWRLLWAAIGFDEGPALEVANLWKILGAWMILKGGDGVNEIELPGWSEFRGVSPAEVRARAEAASARPAVRESLPDWLYDLGSRELGARWDSILSELNVQAPVVLRANRLRGTREELQKRLAAEDVATEFAPATVDGLRLVERKNIFPTTSFKGGFFEVQDGASQQVAPLLDPQPGHRVIDACAGAGGKTLHLAALMKNKGKIIAMDVGSRKLDELRKRCSRDGVDIVEVKLIEGSKSIKRLANTADRLLLDVPCSGLGVLRRNPDSKWKLSLEEVERLHGLQAEIINTYSEMVKPGGRMVYATCSILPSENGQRVADFLSTRSEEWRLIEERSFWPGQDGYDGFYAALLERVAK